MKAKIFIPGVGDGWVDLKDLNFTKIRITDIQHSHPEKRDKK